MADAVFAKGLEGFATAAVNWPSADVRPIFIDEDDYTVNLSTHDFLDDVTAGAIIGSPGASIASKTATDGVLDGDDYTMTTVSGDEFEAIILYVHTGTDSTSRLLFYFDSYSGLPFTPSGGNIVIQWPSDSNKIAKI